MRLTSRSACVAETRSAPFMCFFVVVGCGVDGVSRLLPSSCLLLGSTVSPLPPP